MSSPGTKSGQLSFLISLSLLNPLDSDFLTDQPGPLFLIALVIPSLSIFCADFNSFIFSDIEDSEFTGDAGELSIANTDCPVLVITKIEAKRLATNFFIYLK
jgi:hypothetical protein